MMRLRLALAVTAAIAAASPAIATERYAIIISGAAGGDAYAKQYDDWRMRLTKVVADRLAFGRDHVVVLGEVAGDGVQVATRENVRRAVNSVAARMRQADLLLLVLVGHGTFDGNIAKFNLPGPDLDAAEWAALLSGVRGHLVVVNTAGASFPFLGALSARGRIVITATDSPAGRFDTVFPEYFVKALEDASRDGSHADRLSVWEVFTAASAGVRRYYEEKGLLPVEHALLDDAGDGFGKDADQPGTDASFAQALLLTADAADRSTDAAVRELAAQRDELLGEIEKLKAKKASMDPDEYQAELEKLLVALAKVSRELRGKT